MFAQKLCARAAIASHHSLLFAGIYRGTRVSEVEPSIRFARPDVAVVAWPSVLHVAGEKRPAPALTVFVRTADRWEIVSLQNMAPLPPPA